MNKKAFFILLIISLASCVDDREMIDQLIQQEFQRKLSLIRMEHEQKCRQDILRIAEEIMDSLILHEELRPLTEDEYRPYIPKRPDFIAPDSSVFNSQRNVKPIID